MINLIKPQGNDENMLRLFLKICFFIIAVLLIVFLVPQSAKKTAKDKIISTLSNVLPTSAKEKLEGFTFNPAEKRERFIAQIEQELTAAKKALEQAKTKKQKLFIAAPSQNDSLDEEIKKNIEVAEQLLNKLKENNNEPGIIKKAITSAAEAVQDFINGPASGTSDTNSDNSSIITNPASIITSTSTQTQLPFCPPCVCQ